jgi:transposase-like protein
VLSKEAKKKYIKASCHCPYCGSENIEARGDKDVDSDGIELRQVINCLDCEKEWQDVYKLVGIEEIEE